ncbi:MAG: hypothetical protein GXC76_11075 [Rhodanobacteraceae bacterium]|jgi:opacity protein-like surface antigen|nr:hypothetical protein [Rhodanobacteraceae bacterium]
MKAHAFTLSALALCLASAAAAQTPPAADTHTTTYQTPQGELIVNWGQPPARDFGPPPPFAQLDRKGAGYIGSDEADAYPPLANDFNYADLNHDGRISKHEYDWWVRQH